MSTHSPDRAADAAASDWDELFNAVCARLTQFAEHSSERTIRDGVPECVGALAQLGACAAQERALHRRQQLELAALQKRPAAM
jgi:hypothetical protein